MKQDEETEIETYTIYLKSLKHFRFSTMFTTLSMWMILLVTIHMGETFLGGIALIVALVSLYVFLKILWECRQVAKAIKTLEKLAGT